MVGGTSGSVVNLAAAAALGFPLRQHFACCTCIFCSALILHALLQHLSAVEALVESAKTAAIPRFLVAFTPEAIVEGSGFRKELVVGTELIFIARWPQTASQRNSQSEVMTLGGCLFTQSHAVPPYLVM